MEEDILDLIIKWSSVGLEVPCPLSDEKPPRNDYKPSILKKEMELLRNFPSQCTASTELYVPPSSPCKDDISHGASSFLQAPKPPTTLVSSSPLSPLREVSLNFSRQVRKDCHNLPRNPAGDQMEGGCSIEGGSKRSGSESTRKSGKRKKLSSSQLAATDVSSAVGLTVTAAEAMVISSLLEEETTDGRLTPSVVLEAAIRLRCARQNCGLDEYYVGEISAGRVLAAEEVVSGIRDEEDAGLLNDIKDSEMVEAFADIGFMDAAETEELEEYGLNWGHLKIGNGICDPLVRAKEPPKHIQCGSFDPQPLNNSTPETLPYHHSFICKNDDLSSKIVCSLTMEDTGSSGKLHNIRHLDMNLSAVAGDSGLARVGGGGGPDYVHFKENDGAAAGQGTVVDNVLVRVDCDKPIINFIENHVPLSRDVSDKFAAEANSIERVGLVATETDIIAPILEKNSLRENPLPGSSDGNIRIQHNPETILYHNNGSLDPGSRRARPFREAESGTPGRALIMTDGEKSLGLVSEEIEVLKEKEYAVHLRNSIKKVSPSEEGCAGILVEKNMSSYHDGSPLPDSNACGKWRGLGMKNSALRVETLQDQDQTAHKLVSAMEEGSWKDACISKEKVGGLDVRTLRDQKNLEVSLAAAHPVIEVVAAPTPVQIGGTISRVLLKGQVVESSQPLAERNPNLLHGQEMHADGAEKAKKILKADALVKDIPQLKLKDGVLDITLQERIDVNRINTNHTAWTSKPVGPTNDVAHRSLRGRSSYNSRWLGGWNDQNLIAEGNALTNTMKNFSCGELETSYLSDPWDIGSEDAGPERAVAIKRRRISGRGYLKGTIIGRGQATPTQTKALLDPSVLRKDLVVCMSQSSVSGSSAPSPLADPRSSFIPCSVPEEVRPNLPLGVNQDGGSVPVGKKTEIGKRIELSDRVLEISISKDKDHGGGPLSSSSLGGACALDSVKRTHVSSLRRYSTSENPCLYMAGPAHSLQLLLNAVELAGDSQEGGEANCEPAQVSDKGRSSLHTDARKSPHQPEHLQASLKLLDDARSCEALSLARGLAEVDVGGKDAEEKGGKNKSQENAVPRDAHRLINGMENLDSSLLDLDESLSLDALAGVAVQVIEAQHECEEEDAETLHDWKTKFIKENGGEKKVHGRCSSSEIEQHEVQDQHCKRTRRSSDSYVCLCNSSELSPPLLWPGGKNRRLRACRVIETESEEFPEEGQDALKPPTSPPNEGPEKVIVAESIAREELQYNKAKRAVAFEVFSFTHEENVLPARQKPQELHPVPSPTSRKATGLKKSTEGNQSKLVKKKLLKTPKADIPTSKIRKRKAVGDKGSKNVVKKKGPLCGGLQFLLTGFPQDQKDKLVKVIEEHRGLVLSTIPHPSPLQARNTRGQDISAKSPPIILAPQQVRTPKFLFGCAVRSPTLMTTWLCDSISAKKLLPYTDYEHQPKRSIKPAIEAVAEGAELVREEKQEGPIFQKIQFFLHGKPTHCALLRTLIQHGGGKVVSNVNSMDPETWNSGDWVGLAVAEDLSKVPCSLRRDLSRLKLQLVAEEWVVESLLLRCLLPVPASSTSKRQRKALPRSTSPSEHNLNLQESPIQKKNLPTCREGSPVPKKQHTSRSKRSIQAPDLIPKQVVRKIDEWSWLGASSVRLHCAPELVAGLTEQVIEAFPGPKQQRNCLFYRSVSSNGVHYSVGDILEIQPLSPEETITYVARLEGLWSEEIGKKRRKAGSSKRPEKVVMRCRWFYLPSETGFPCSTSANDLYLSNHFDDGVHISRILKKVKVAIVVQGQLAPCNNWTLEDDSARSELIRDYNCTYFYDHEKESLHQIKMESLL